MYDFSSLKWNKYVIYAKMTRFVQVNEYLYFHVLIIKLFTD